MLSIIIPAHNEEDHIKSTVLNLYNELVQANISHEILVINDCSKDNTEEIVLDLKKKIKSLNCIKNYHPQGFGYAVRCGLSNYKGDSVCIFMADESDSPKDVIAFYHKLQQGFDCVFGSRFIKNGKLINYPFTKKILNRLGNLFIRILFLMKYNDTTNAFKMFRRHVIDGIQPILACHFNLTVELPLKAIVRGYKYAVLPNSWSNRKKGKSKFLIREIGSRYLFIIFYCLIEKLFSKNDYIKKDIND